MRDELNKMYKWLHDHKRQVRIRGDGVVDHLIEMKLPSEKKMMELWKRNPHLGANKKPEECLYTTLKRNYTQEVRMALRRWIEVGRRRGEYRRKRN